MQLRTTFLSLLAVALAVGHQVSGEPVPRTDSEHKFNKRGYHVHNNYHSPASSGGGGGGGLFGGSMGKTILGGTALAGGAAFAGTAGMIGAHRLFDGEGDRGGRSPEQPVQQEPSYVPVRPTSFYSPATTPGMGSPYPQGGQVFPVGVLMSDGSTVPVPKSLLQQAQENAARYPQSQFQP